MAGLHECPHCHYRFEDAEPLQAHLAIGCVYEEQGPVIPHH